MLLRMWLLIVSYIQCHVIGLLLYQTHKYTITTGLSVQHV